MTEEKKEKKTVSRVTKKKEPKTEAKAEVKEEHKHEHKKEDLKHETKPDSKEHPATHTKNEEKTEAKPETPKKTRKKSASKKGKAVIGRGKRKESIARATIKSGNGKVTFNSLAVHSLNNKYIRDIIREPLKFLSPEELIAIDVNVSVNGGGVMGQAQAARTAIANAIVNYLYSKDIENRMLDFDRSLLIADPRRVESKKFKGPKARARFQKSYR